MWHDLRVVAHWILIGFIVVLIARTLISWFGEKICSKPGVRHVHQTTRKLTEPVVDQFRRFGWMRPIAMFDVAPMAAMMVAFVGIHFS